jgi:hypothetical protein
LPDPPVSPVPAAVLHYRRLLELITDVEDHMEYVHVHFGTYM